MEKKDSKSLETIAKSLQSIAKSLSIIAQNTTPEEDEQFAPIIVNGLKEVE